jgi:uncharacterized protein
LVVTFAKYSIYWINCWVRRTIQTPPNTLRWSELMIATEALVAATDPARTITRVCNHFKHRVEVTRETDRAVVQFPGATCVLLSTGKEISMRLQAEDTATSERLQAVIAKHLKQVAQPEALVIEWRAAGIA